MFTNAAGTQEFYNSPERTKPRGIPQGSEGARLHEAKRYLNQFGYLKYEDSNNLENDEALELAIKTYQTFYQLEVTGKSLIPTPSSKWQFRIVDYLIFINGKLVI